MEIQYENILLQILMVLFPIVLFLTMFNTPLSSKKKKVTLGIICAVTMSLSLAVPIYIREGIFIDLRMVPWYIAFMYGGNVVGIFVTLFFVIVRFFIGGLGMITAFTVLIIFTGIIQIFRKSYMDWVLRKKIAFSVTFISLASISLIVVGLIFFHGQIISTTRIVIYSFFILESAIVTWLVVFLIESHKEKLQLFQDIQRTEKLNVVGQLAASVAHEIRNPMTSVRGFIQLLSNSKNVSDEEKQYIKICLEELDRANSIIGDYLSLGRDYSLSDEDKVDVALEIKRAINTLSSYTNLKNVEVLFEHSNPAYIVGNSGRLQQLFVNLIKNGIEAVSDNGKIVVIIKQTDDDVVVSIADNGVGMKQKQIDNLGLPFYSTKEKGTGLGLMVCLRIVKDLGGTMSVQSTEGLGTTFTIKFPALNIFS